MTALTRADLETLLPHRHPFLLLDRAEDFQAHRSLTGVIHTRADAPYFAGHFPGRPILPGVLLVEAMAQTGAALSMKSDDLDRARALLMLALVESARFRAPVTPDMTLRLAVEQRSARHGLYRYRGEALVDGRRIGEAAFAAKLVWLEQ
jgi:3-hydroxyacyl-[acyl-carrier-protein] dehydratase